MELFSEERSAQVATAPGHRPVTTHVFVDDSPLTERNSHDGHR
jgi:hypothetical protein